MTEPFTALDSPQQPTKSWLGALQHDLEPSRTSGHWRSLSPVTVAGPVIETAAGETLTNFAGNDYLALSQHPDLKKAAADAVASHGVGSGASRLISGHSPEIASLEARFARFKHAQSALLMPTGYLANLAAITTLAGDGDVIYLDKLCHASIIDAARSSGATVRVFPHRHYAKLERLLQRGANQGAGTGASGPAARGEARSRADRRGAPQRLIVTDSVFSMDGDVADLPALCDLADRYDAVLLVDEAHGTGVLGDTGAGLSEYQGVADRVDVTVSTASKALGGLGGIVTGPCTLIEAMVNRARSLIYTTAPPPAQVAAIHAALDVIDHEPQRRLRLMELARRLHEALADQGWPRVKPVDDPPTPICPVIVGDQAQAVQFSDQLKQKGMFVPAIRPPTVAPGSARLRISLRADHRDQQIDQLIDALGPMSLPGRCSKR